MSTWEEKHGEAMGFTDHAMRARRRGDAEETRKLFAEALVPELEALRLMGDIEEPLYSTMYRSAATIALESHDYRLAEKLASTALAKDPPGYLIAELREVVELANLHRHLGSDGLVLAEDEVQMSLSGGMIASGFAPLEDFIPRLEGMRKLLRKVWSYINDQDHPESENSDAPTLPAPNVLISPPSASSLAVTLRIGGPTQAKFPKVAGTPTLVSEMLNIIEAVAQSGADELAQSYPDETYRRNFVELIRSIAPDGKNVTQVGFTAISGGNERRLPLTTTKLDLSERFRLAPKDSTDREEIITGELRFADGVNESKQTIKVIPTEGKARQIKVPAGMMDDIVRPRWGEVVSARCTVRGKRNVATLVEIDAV